MDRSKHISVGIHSNPPRPSENNGFSMVLGRRVGPDGNTPLTAVVETVVRDTANTKTQVVAAWGYGVASC